MRLLVTVLLILFATPGLAAERGKSASAEDLYEQGLRQMQRGYYTKALESFNRVRNYHRDEPVSVKAQLAIADVYFKKRDFEQARFAYEEFASYHPRHENLDYVTYKIGLSIYKRAPKAAGRDQTATRGAVNVWTGFDTRFPESSYSEDVDRLHVKGRNRLAAKELFIANFYADRDAWGASRGRCEVLLRRYPDSAHAEPALALMAESMHRWGFVDDAQAAVVRLREDFPDSKYLSRVDRVLAQAPGSPPDEKVFIRPYRIRGVGQQGPAGAY